MQQGGEEAPGHRIETRTAGAIGTGDQGLDKRAEQPQGHAIADDQQVAGDARRQPGRKVSLLAGGEAQAMSALQDHLALAFDKRDQRGYLQSDGWELVAFPTMR